MNYKEEMELMHFGVMGMRWGQRRAQNGAAAVRKVGGAYANSMAKKQERIKKESAERISGAKNSERAIRKVSSSWANALERKKTPGADRGAASVRKVGTAYANAMAKKQERIKKESDGRIKEAKAGEKAIRKGAKAYAKTMDAKAERIGKQLDAKTKAKLDSKINKLDAKSKNNTSWLKKQADEWKKAFEDVSKEEARAAARSRNS